MYRFISFLFDSWTVNKRMCHMLVRFCLLEIVGETITGLNWRVLFSRQTFLIYFFKNISFLFRFCFCSCSCCCFFFFVNGKTTNFFVIFIFTPVNRLRSFCCSKNKIPCLRGAHISGHFSVVKTRSQFFLPGNLRWRDLSV